MQLSIICTHRKHGVEAVCTSKGKEKKGQNISPTDPRNEKVFILRVMFTNNESCLQ